jgi:hypothetical protein
MQSTPLDKIKEAFSLDKGYGYKKWLEHDDDFASIRDTPPFKAILVML